MSGVAPQSGFDSRRSQVRCPSKRSNALNCKRTGGRCELSGRQRRQKKGIVQNTCLLSLQAKTDQLAALRGIEPRCGTSQGRRHRKPTQAF